MGNDDDQGSIDEIGKVDVMGKVSELYPDPITEEDQQNFNRLEKSEQRRAALLVLNALVVSDPELAKVVVRSCIDGLSLSEIGEELGVQKPAISKRRAKGIRILRHYMKDVIDVMCSKSKVAPNPTPATTVAARSP